jgi:cytochrome c-type biogenesis protein CcmH
LRERVADAALALGRDPASLPIIAKLDRAVAQGAAQAPAEGEIGAAEIADMVARLAARLEADPQDLEGWLMLARSYQVLGQPEQAQAAIARADAVFAKAPFVRRQIAEAARELGLAPPGEAAPPPSTSEGRGPSDSDVAAAMALPEQDRKAMIRGMVDGLAARLEAEPDDLQGWLMLLRSYRVLEEEALLTQSLGRARSLFAARPEARAEIERLADELGLPPENPPQSQ